MKHPLLATLAVVGLVWGACQHRRVTRAETTRDSALAVSATQGVIAEKQALAADSALTVASRALSASRALQLSADRLLGAMRHAPLVIPPDSTPTDSSRYWRERHRNASDSAQVLLGALETLQGSLDTLSVAYQAQREATERFREAYEGQRSRADGLAKTLHDIPIGGCRILGVIPCPVVAGGMGATLSGGRVYTGPSVTAGWQISF